MDFSSALKPDVYRVAVWNLVPGFVGVAPWVSGVFWPDLQDVGLWGREGALIPIAVTLSAVVFAAGLVFEDVGSRIEVYWADRWLQKRCKRFSRGWRVYLAQKRDSELIAQGYLRAILLRFKFELSMVPAMLSCALGLIFAQAAGHGFGAARTWILLILLLLLELAFLDEIRRGAVVLARTRKIIVRTPRIRP